MTTEPLSDQKKHVKCSAKLFNDKANGIQDGDILLFRGTYFLSKFFECITNSYYSHAGMAVWWGDLLMVLQAEATGLQAVPFHLAVGRYKGRVDWYRLQRDSFDSLPADCDFDARRRRVLDEAKADLGMRYGFVEVIPPLVNRVYQHLKYWTLKILLHLPYWPLADRHRKLARPRAMFCSEFVAWCFEQGGLRLVADEAEVTFPQDIAASTHLKHEASLDRDADCTGMEDKPAEDNCHKLRAPPCGKQLKKQTWRHRRKAARKEATS